MYLYEMHCHSNACSACSGVTPEDLVHSYKASGYAGLVLTDHCSRGNTCVPRDIPWKEQADIFYNAYLTAKAVGDELDFDVLFGLEYNYGRGKEALLYGINLNFLYNFKNFNRAPLSEAYERVHACGGLIIAAHPFRNRSYIEDHIAPPPLEYLDGVEAVNYCDTPEDDERELAFANAHPELILTSGSDWHSKATEIMAGMEFNKRIKTGAELVAALKNREGKMFCKGKRLPGES